MDDEGSDTVSAKYAKLEPKSSINAQLAMSKVHISKNWKLPPRLKPGRKPRSSYERSKANVIRAEPPPNDEDYSESEDSQVKKKRQNRDAQRAYRERRASRLEQLEGTVETLQNMVKTWQRKCKSYEIELAQSEKNITKVEEENLLLRRRLKDSESASVCTSCPKKPLISKKLEIHTQRESDTATLLLDPFLQNVISNFKPMKAVTLKKRKLSNGPDLELSPPASLSFNRFSSLSPTTPTSSSISGKCGFCSDSSTCVCKEFKDENAGAAKADRCSEDTLNCTKCSNIDESCIRPTVPPVTNEGKWKPGSCRQCKADPQSRAFCKTIFSSASSASPNNNSVDNGSYGTEYSSEFSKSVQEEPVCFNTTDSSLTSSWKDDISHLLGAENDTEPNTMDPNFKPGSCANCQADPQRKAFCQAIFGSPSKNDSETKHSTLNKIDSDKFHHDQGLDNGTEKPVSCRCQSKSVNAALCKPILQGENSMPDDTANPNATDLMKTVTLNVPKSKEFIPISDAYQRVRKYMHIRNANQEEATNSSSSSLPPPMKRIALGLRVRGKEVELRSIDDAIRDMDKNALG